MMQDNFFPDRALPTIVELYPSLITRWKRSADRNRRVEGNYFDARCEEWHKRIQAWSSPTDLFSNARFVNFWFTLWNEFEESKMSGKKARTDLYEQPAWKGFLERPLSDDEVAQCDDWTPEPGEIFEAVNDLCNNGYTLKLSYSRKLNAATATMVDSVPESKAAGYALSARDANAALALKMLLYKHMVALDGTWDALVGAAPRSKRG